MASLFSKIYSFWGFLILLGVNCLFSFILFKNAHQGIRSIALNPKYETLDVTFGYDKGYVLQLFKDLTPKGVELYREIEWKIDMAFPVLYGFLFSVSIYLLVNCIKNSNDRKWFLFPFIGTIADVCENSFVIKFTTQQMDEINPLLVKICSIFTMIKYSMIGSSLVVILILLFILLVRFLTKKSTKAIQ